jgi:hypothetical protein
MKTVIYSLSVGNVLTAGSKVGVTQNTFNNQYSFPIRLKKFFFSWVATETTSGNGYTPGVNATSGVPACQIRIYNSTIDWASGFANISGSTMQNSGVPGQGVHDFSQQTVYDCDILFDANATIGIYFTVYVPVALSNNLNTTGTLYLEFEYDEQLLTGQKLNVKKIPK